MDEICQKTGMTKGCLFHYFKDKEALGQALLEDWAKSMDEAHQALLGSDPDPLNRVRKYVDGLKGKAEDGSLGKGCLMAVFAQEMKPGSAIHTATSSAFRGWIDLLAREIKLAKDRHAPSAGFEPRELAEALVAAMEGALVLERAGRKGAVARGLGQFRGLLDLLMKG